jgi:TIR domain
MEPSRGRENRKAYVILADEETGPPVPVEVFCSYSHQDERLWGKLQRHLTPLKRSGYISEWYDRKIDAGAEWAVEIDAHLNSATIVLLLISSDFLASDYCYGVEMKRALERHEKGEASVIPVILRPVLWSGEPFAKLQALVLRKNFIQLDNWMV